MSRATGLATSGREAQGGLKTRRPEFAEFIAVTQEEDGPSAALSPLEEKGDMGRVGGTATFCLHEESLVQAGSCRRREIRERRRGCGAAGPERQP